MARQQPHISTGSRVFLDSEYLCKTLGVPNVIDLFLEALFCVLSVGISPTKSMSTKNPELGKTDRQFQIQFKGQVSMYIYIFYIYIWFYQKYF